MERAILDGLSTVLCHTQLQWVFNELQSYHQNSPWMQLCESEMFRTAFRLDHPERSGVESTNILSALRSQTDLYGLPVRGIFSLIISVAAQFLHMEGHEVRCHHNKLVEWRMLTQQTGQSLFLCAFLAWNDLRCSYSRNYFSFSPYVKSDHLRLRQMLARGMAENHFHLKGSAPSSTLSWICLMNNIDKRGGSEGFGHPALRHALANGEMESAKWADSLYRLTSTAACLRLILWGACTGGDPSPLLETLLKVKPWDSNVCPLHPYWTHTVQNAINGKRLFSKSQLDYLQLNSDHINNESTTYCVLSGEHRFLYEMFRHILQDLTWTKQYGTLFYAYLLVFIRFRRELAQCNGAYGFDNFSLYQDRKELFLRPPYQKELVHIAFNSVLENQSIKSLEARIVLPPSPPKLRQKLRYCIQSIPFDNKTSCSVDKYTFSKRFYSEAEHDPRVFFVIHIPKTKDNSLKKAAIIPNSVNCRHYAYRSNVVWPEIYALTGLFRQGSILPKWIRGLDACSQEIACRPEVFAPAFRYARYMAVSKWQAVSPLRLTYHVGEDFLDIVDGLRAIDEAIKYLNLKHGDRLGHALALGIAPDLWYEKRHNSLILSAQDLLDNTMWFLHTLRELNWRDEALQQELEGVYSNLCFRIYQRAIPLAQYWQAWLLRGDEPRYYRNKSPFLWGDDQNRLSPDLTCRTLRENDPDVRELYRCYHYDLNVRQAGEMLMPFTIPQGYVQAVCAVQQAMRNKISYLGIGIETNPSSNYLISQFGPYEKHPIVTFYDRYLHNPPQGATNFVSINTDDQGVFDTDLENEFSLMASALENAKGPDGNCLYTPEAVYLWIDQIRKMGLEQSFLLNGSEGVLNP